MRKPYLGAVAALLLAQASPLSAADAIDDVAARFGALPSVIDISLSPAGDKIAYVSPAGPSTEVVYVVDLAAGAGAKPVPILAHPDPDSELSWCVWATEDRLICQATYISDKAGVLLGFSRLYALDDTGKNIIQLTAQDSSNALDFEQNGGAIVALEVAGKPDKILMTRDWVPQKTTGTLLASDDVGFGVEEVDVRTGARHRAEVPDIANIDYTADEAGRVRLKVEQPIDSDGYRRAQRQYFYRDATSSAWREFKQVAQFKPVAVSSVKNLAYGFVKNGGHDAAVSIALDGSGALTTLEARDDVDVDQLIQIGRTRRVVGASFATEKRQVDYFDPDLRKLSAQLQKALPGKPLIDVIDASADESKLMLVASSDTDPGVVYLYDKAKRELNQLLPVRRELFGRPMGTMSPVVFPAADGTMIPGYLTLPPGSDGKNLPAIVMPHGGPSARDEWGFDWLVQFFVARGYAVLQPNYRGSAGYGDAWFGENGFKAWKTAIGDVNDAGRWLVNQGVADPGKLAIVGWSYGGYAALQSQVLDNRLYKAVVAIAPVTDLGTFREEHRPYEDFRLVDQFVGEGPQIEEGSPARHAAQFAAPVLLFHGTIDQNVAAAESRNMKDRLEGAGKKVTYVEFAGLDHYLDDGQARATMLKDIDGFLAGALGK